MVYIIQLFVRLLFQVMRNKLGEWEMYLCSLCFNRPYMDYAAEIVNERLTQAVAI